MCHNVNIYRKFSEREASRINLTSDTDERERSNGTHAVCCYAHVGPSITPSHILNDDGASACLIYSGTCNSFAVLHHSFILN